MKQVAEDQPVQPEAGGRALHVAHRPLHVGEVLEACLSIDGMCHAFGISRATFYRREKRGHFVAFLIQPTHGYKVWSGALVDAYLKGQSQKRPIFGRASR